MTRIEERAELLRQRVDGESYLFAAVICNGCGAQVLAPNPEKLAKMTPGWRIGGFGENADYCPRCLG